MAKRRVKNIDFYDEDHYFDEEYDMSPNSYTEHTPMSPSSRQYIFQRNPSTATNTSSQHTQSSEGGTDNRPGAAGAEAAAASSSHQDAFASLIDSATKSGKQKQKKQRKAAAAAAAVAATARNDAEDSGIFSLEPDDAPGGTSAAAGELADKLTPQKLCEICTFVNPPKNAWCDMCESELPPSRGGGTAGASSKESTSQPQRPNLSISAPPIAAVGATTTDTFAQSPLTPTRAARPNNRKIVRPHTVTTPEMRALVAQRAEARSQMRKLDLGAAAVTPKAVSSNAADSPGTAGTVGSSAKNFGLIRSKSGGVSVVSSQKVMDRKARLLKELQERECSVQLQKSKATGSKKSEAASAGAAASSESQRRRDEEDIFAVDGVDPSKTLKERINIVVIGHVDAGKSTIMGHLLHLVGEIDERTMRGHAKDAQTMGKASFRFAWALDHDDTERERGVTVDVASAHFETEHRDITVLDAPGHRDFIPNMIGGAAQADAALLIVPAAVGEFESGFQDDGQTKEHAVLARSLGISELIVVVNKLDQVGWARDRYQFIDIEVRKFLKSAGFRDKQVVTVPVSGLTGENLVPRADLPKQLKNWYAGPSLLERLDALSLPTRDFMKPLRMAISNVFRMQSLGLTVRGKIDRGAIVAGEKLLVMPINEVVTVKAINVATRTDVDIGIAGDTVDVGLKDVTDPAMLLTGQILCDPAYPVPLVQRFKAQIITLNVKRPIIGGDEVVLFTQAASEPATVSKLISLLNKATGEVTSKRPRVLPRNVTAMVEITTARTVCVERFRDCRAFGRISIRRGNETIAVGIVTKIYALDV